MKLNHEQDTAKELILQFLKNNDYNFFGLTGSGGTGKSTVICQALANEKSIVYLGATNKVTGVLKSNLVREGVENPKVKTIDSFLGFRMIKDEFNNTKITYKIPKPKDLPKIIVIDEISMITFQKFEQIQNLSEHCKIILIGDHLQIPPIEEDRNSYFINEKGFKVSKVFSVIAPENSFNLTIQNRQKNGSDLYALISGFRQHMHLKIPAKKLAEKKHNGIDILYYNNNDPKFKEFLKENESTAVCFKNLTVITLNWLIGSTKSMKKDYKLNEINVGDKLIFDQFYKHKEDSFYTSNMVTILEIEKNVSERFEIKKGMIKTITFNKLKVIDEFEQTKTIRYVHGGLYGENGGGVSASVYNQRKTHLKYVNAGMDSKDSVKYLKDLNTRFLELQNSFAKLKRAYAITCHKSQGSTYDNVIIPVYDFYANNHLDINQLMYVALSRAKSKIIFLDKNDNFKDNSNRYSFSEFEKNAICSAKDYKCCECRTNLLDRGYQIDHKLPLANGGKNTIENLQALCIKCHKNKTAKEIYS